MNIVESFESDKSAQLFWIGTMLAFAARIDAVNEFEWWVAAYEIAPEETANHLWNTSLFAEPKIGLSEEGLIELKSVFDSGVSL